MLCEAAFRTEDGRCVIAGTFSRLHAAVFPAFHPAWSLYARLLDAAGDHTLRVRIVDLRTAEAIGETRAIEVRIVDPLVGTEILVPMPPMRIAAPATFGVEVLWSDARIVLGDWRVTVSGGNPG